MEHEKNPIIDSPESGKYRAGTSGQGYIALSVALPLCLPVSRLLKWKVQQGPNQWSRSCIIHGVNWWFHGQQVHTRLRLVKKLTNSRYSAFRVKFLGQTSVQCRINDPNQWLAYIGPIQDQSRMEINYMMILSTNKILTLPRNIIWSFFSYAYLLIQLAFDTTLLLYLFQIIKAYTLHLNNFAEIRIGRKLESCTVRSCRTRQEIPTSH